MAELGRPSIYTDDLANKICAIIATSSKSLKKICETDEMPSVSTVLKWLNTNEAFLRQYTRAKEEQADLLVDEMIEIADDGSQDLDGYNDYGKPIENKEFVNRSRLKVETRKWIASKLKPKRYGEKLDVTSGDKPLEGQTLIIKGEKFAKPDEPVE